MLFLASVAVLEARRNEKRGNVLQYVTFPKGYSSCCCCGWLISLLLARGSECHYDLELFGNALKFGTVKYQNVTSAILLFMRK